MFKVTAGKLSGFISTKIGIEVDPTKIKVIKEMPAPRAEKELRSFLGKTQQKLVDF